MRRTGLSVALVVCFTAPTLAVAEPDEGGASNSSVVSVSEFLKQTAKRPLELGDVSLLRAIADLMEKEQAIPTPVELRSRLTVRLRNAPVVDVAKALEEFLENERAARQSASSSGDRTFFVSDITSNTLLLSTRGMATPLLELIAKLDADPDVVTVSVCIAELTHADGDADVNSGMTGRWLQGEEADAWIEEAKKQGRLKVLGRPQIRTLDNQPASIKMGKRVSVVRPGENQIEIVEVGLTIDLTPRITPTGSIIMELDIERGELGERDAAGRAAIRTTRVQTVLSAEDGQTLLLGGLNRKTKHGMRELIIAVTPRVNPQR